MNKKVLWVSPYAPYDCVRHAGGKNENFYVKGIHENPDIDLVLLSFVNNQEEYYLAKKDLTKYNIKHWLSINVEKNEEGLFKKILYKVKTFNKYAGIINDSFWETIEKQIDKKFMPDVIIIEWTEFIFFATKFRSLYPQAKIIAMEEDVTFLKYFRYYKKCHCGIKKLFKLIRYKRIKKSEITALKKSDLVIVNNFKDEKLLHDNGVNNTWRLSIFFQSEFNFQKKQIVKKNIIFYGAMGRIENYESCIWFIDNVMPLLDKTYKFIIVGNNPPKALEQYSNDNIEITGYVEDVSLYFSDALCMVTPLISGAGIKAKVLEGMSYGLPVLANEIGIEGIPATNNKEYIFCNSPNEYAIAIRYLYDNKKAQESIGKNGKNLIENSFNYKKNLREFIEIIKKCE